eukprot:12983.XXX_399441_399650_1 [CDS] Oithona nana genome sequencing.
MLTEPRPTDSTVPKPAVPGGNLSLVSPNPMDEPTRVAGKMSLVNVLAVGGRKGALPSSVSLKKVSCWAST